VSGPGQKTPAGDGPRRAPRVSSREFPELPDRVNYRADGTDGTGVLWDISASGAQVAEASSRLQPGTAVDMYFLLGRDLRPAHAVAEVVRETRSGFCVRFQRIERPLTELVLSAAAKQSEGDPPGSG
jgi:hypothetical protein